MVFQSARSEKTRVRHLMIPCTQDIWPYDSDALKNSFSLGLSHCGIVSLHQLSYQRQLSSVVLSKTTEELKAL